MITTKTAETIFIHNSDMSGNVIIRRGDKEVEIPGTDLLVFLGQHLIQKRIAHLERQDQIHWLLNEVRRG